MTGRRSLARNVFSNWLVLAVSGVYALAITPLVVRTLDTELYGVWSFLNGLLAYAEMFYLDLGVAYIKYVAQFLARGDRPAITRLTRVISTLYFAKGAAAFALLLWLGAVLPDVFAEPLSAGATAAVPLTCALLGVRVWLMFIATVYSGLLCGHDRFDLVNGVHLSVIVARLIATPLLLDRGHDPLLTMAWITAGMGAAEAIALGIVAERHVGGITIRPVRPAWFELGRLYGFGLQSAFVLLAIKLINHTDTTVIGITLGAASVAVFALPLQLVELARLGVGGFVGVLLPRVEKLTLGPDARTDVRKTFVKTARVGCLLTGWLSALLIAVGPSFLTRWVGPEYGDPAQWLFGVLVARDVRAGVVRPDTAAVLSGHARARGPRYRARRRGRSESGAQPVAGPSHGTDGRGVGDGDSGAGHRTNRAAAVSLSHTRSAVDHVATPKRASGCAHVHRHAVLADGAGRPFRQPFLYDNRLPSGEHAARRARGDSLDVPGG